jgi:hypothetical protein
MPYFGFHLVLTSHFAQDFTQLNKFNQPLNLLFLFLSPTSKKVNYHTVPTVFNPLTGASSVLETRLGYLEAPSLPFLRKEPSDTI